MMGAEVPDLLTGTEITLVAWVGRADNKNGLPRWQQVHFNREIARQFFNLEPGDDRAITLEKISGEGRVVERTSKRLVYSEANKNIKIEFHFGPRDLAYPDPPERPLLVVVEADHLTYRYRTLLPGQSGHGPVKTLLLAGPSVGKGLHRRLVTLNDVESVWPQAHLRGGVG
jgi:hypothetical protein